MGMTIILYHGSLFTPTHWNVEYETKRHQANLTVHLPGR